MSAEPALRLFFALWPPAALAGRLAAIAQQRADDFGGKPARAETLHLTLAFLGDVAVERLDELARAVAPLVLPAMALRLDRLRVWQHNRLLWAGCAEMPLQLAEFTGRLRTRLAEAGFDGDRSGHGFTPHVTLLRHLQRPPTTDWVEAAALDDLPVWQADRVLLVASERSAAGAAYRKIGEFFAP